MINKKILPCVLGLGYVGMPIFNILNKKFKTIGYDINKERINELKNKHDRNNEFSKNDLVLKNESVFSFNDKDLKDCNFFIICVPTPVFQNKKPNLKPLREVSDLITKYIKKKDIIFFESTVYPGVTKYLIKNILEKKSKLKNNKDFWTGYSPERISPGDKNKTIQKINKIVAINRNNKEVKYKVEKIYKNLTKKIFYTKSLEEAEFSKVIENVQRDINIAFMNEIFQISNKLDINFFNVIDLASTKWNFLKFSPGLVGGHCLPVDPYYLYFAAKKRNLEASFLLSGRTVNNNMEKYVIKKIYNEIKKIKKNKPKIVLAGISYKAEVSDIRNSIPFSIYQKLKKNQKLDIIAYDPILDKSVAKKFNIKKNCQFNNKKIDLAVMLVNHNILIKKFSNKKLFKETKILDIFKYLNNE
jgi:UDP-N-acetyl-D-galactosamine dehydrogenase